jgi:hypothetical protein
VQQYFLQKDLAFIAMAAATAAEGEQIDKQKFNHSSPA